MKIIRQSKILYILLFILGIAVTASCGGGGGGGGDNSGGGGTSGGGGGSPTTYTIGGTVSGLFGTGLVLQNNSGDNLAISGNGAFNFNTSMANSSAYAVTVSTQPTGPAQSCNVLRNGSGTVSGANVTNVVVDCTATRFAYIPNTYDNTLSIYTIDAATGRLRHNGYITTDTGPRSVAIDPSGKYLYLVSFYSFTIKAYAINAANGALTLVNSLPTGTNPISVTVDPSGKFVYVANGVSDNISAYSIDASTGALTDIGTYAAGNEPLSVTVNPTGQYLYVANQNSSGDGSVSVFSINTSTGVLTTADADGVTAGNQATIAAGTWPQAIILDPSGKFAYVPTWNSNNISAYRVDAGNGSLTPVGTVSSIGTGPTALAIDASGKFAYVSNQTSNNVSVFSINSTTGELVSVDADAVTGGTQTTIAADTSPLSISIDITGKYAYVANMNANNLSAYSINTATGALTPLAKMAARRGPIGIAMANGATAVSYAPAYVYTANSNGGNINGNVSGFSVNPATGALSTVAGSPFLSGWNTQGIAVDPSGTRAYIANYNSTLTGFSIGANGVLSTLSGSPYAAPASQWAWAAAVDPSGRFAYFANYNNAGTGGVSAFTISSTTGALTGLGAVTAGNGSYAISADPAGRFIYVANAYGNSVSAYTINALTGALIQIDADFTTAGVQDFAACFFPTSIAVEPTGKFLYVACDGASAVAAYSINLSTGALTRIDYDAGTAGIQDFSVNRAFAVAIEPRGQWAYITQSGGFNTVGVYAINATTGELSATGSSAATGSNPNSAAVDLSGRFLYVGNRSTHNISAYSIDSSTGAIIAIADSPFAAGTNPVSIATTGTIQ